MIICTLPGCTNQFEPKKGRRFCCPAHRARFAYLPIKQSNEAKRLADLPRRNAEFAAKNRYRFLGSLDGVYSGPDNKSYRSDPRSTLKGAI
jgi:hypothetical protein